MFADLTLVNSRSPHLFVIKIIQFPRWAEVLRASEYPQQTVDSYQVTLRWYLGWCHRNGVVWQWARDFIDWGNQQGAFRIFIYRNLRNDPFLGFAGHVKDFVSHGLAHLNRSYHWRSGRFFGLSLGVCFAGIHWVRRQNFDAAKAGVMGGGVGLGGLPGAGLVAATPVVVAEEGAAADAVECGRPADGGEHAWVGAAGVGGRVFVVEIHHRMVEAIFPGN
jgi:hypothetical protein